MKKKILGLNGSASNNSSNLAVLKAIAGSKEADFELDIIEDLSELPPFRTETTSDGTPELVVEFRKRIENADGIIICTPEYVFSIPSRLKNAIEWCVSTTVFSDKPVGLITASANGEKGHEELKLIMKTVQTIFTDETTLLIPGVKGKVDKEGKITDDHTGNQLKKFIRAYSQLIQKLTVKMPPLSA